MLLYVLLFPQTRFYFFARLSGGTIPIYIYMLFWLLLQGAYVWLQVEGIGRISALGHVGGAAVRVIAWLVWRKREERLY